jgi:protocatechuate 3,4-dioxygenase beta subunit
MTTALVLVLLLGQVAGPEPIVLAGTVVGDDGRPVASAEVVLAEVALPPGGQISRSSFRFPTSPPVVLWRGRSDDEGDFRVPLAIRADDRAGRYRPRIVWAHRPGAAAAFRTIPPTWPPDGAPLRLTLGRPVPVAVRVLGPDGRPAGGARIAPARLRGVPIHRELGDLVAVVADDEGRGVLEAVAPADLELIRVSSESQGTQIVRSPRPEGGERVVRLSPVGRVEGRVAADDPRAVRGLAVHVRTAPDAAADELGAGGTAEARTDEQGRFTVPAIAEGSLAVMLEPRLDLPFRGLFNDRPAVEAGETTRIETALKRAVFIKGEVRERGTGTPIAGAGVCIDMRTEVALVRTDDRGRYSGYALPGLVQPYVDDPPPDYFRPSNLLGRQIVPEGVAEFAVPAEELARGATLTGRVAGPDGRPVPGAAVSGTWASATLRSYRVEAMTDRSGVFRVRGIDPKAEIQLSARRGDAITAAPVSTRTGAEPVTLVVGPGHAVALSGRVVDPEGNPVAGAVVRLGSGTLGPNNIRREGGRVAFDDDGRDVLITGPDGRFETGRILRPDLEYRAEVEAEGRVAARTAWIDPVETPAFPDVALAPVTPTRAVAGRAADADGRPIAGATILQSGDGPRRTRAVTDEAGRFRLPGVVREPAFLFVEGPGLRFGGHRIAAGEDAVELKLPRIGDPPGRDLHTLPPLLPRDREKALALKLLGPEVERLARKEVTADTYVLQEIVPRIDPARCLELAEKDAVADADRVRINVALALLEESPEEAAAVAETIKAPWLRAEFDRKASDATPDSDRARKLDWLDRALVQARAEPTPVARLGALGLIGVRLLDLGAVERGTAVLREGQALAETLPKAGETTRPAPGASARAQFAVRLARIDAAAALDLARGFPAPREDNLLGGIALALADGDPAESERVLGLVKNPYARASRTERIVGRMAAKDRARARRLADALEQPIPRARALGAMARGLAGTDPRAAATRIDEALDLLEALTRAGRDPAGAYQDAASTAAAFLPVIERLGDPARLERSFWRAVALRPPRPEEGDPHGLYEEKIASLAIGLSRYDRGVARQVLEPVARRAGSLGDPRGRLAAPTLFEAAALIDPAWAVALVDALPDDTPGAEARPKALARWAIATVLAHGGPRWWVQVDRYLGQFDDDRFDER